MYFLSTRGDERVTGAQAIVQGLAKDGGLFVPESFPQVTREEFDSMLTMSYPERAAFVLHKYLDDYDYEGLLTACKNAYAKFTGVDPAPLVRIDDGIYILELFHGPTCAFKDMALTLLPYPSENGLRYMRNKRADSHSRGDQRRYGQSRSRRIQGRGRH